MKRILVVDDAQDIAELLTLILENEGYQVRGLSHASDIENQIDIFKPDLLLLDVRIYNLDGYVIADRLKANTKYKNMKIVLISAMFDERKMGLKSNDTCDGFIEKPFSIYRVIKTIADLIGK